jgi:hypothetical protein
MVETAGIGQSDSEIVDLVDFPIYVMTSDFGAPSQLEKIDMLDYAELVVLNKFDKRGAEDALRDVRKQWKRNRTAFKLPDEDVPVYPTIASQFNDPGISWMFANLCRLLRAKLQGAGIDALDAGHRHHAARTARHRADPGPARALPGRDRRAGPRHQSRRRIAGRDREPGAELLRQALRDLDDPALPKALDLYVATEVAPTVQFAVGAASAAIESARTIDRSLLTLRQRYNDAIKSLSNDALNLLREWPARKVDHAAVQRIHGARQGHPGRELPRVAEPPADPEDRRADDARLGRPAQVPDEGKPAGRLPVHRRRVSVPAQRRGSDAHVRGRGHAGAHQSPLPLPQRTASRRRVCRPRSTRSRCTAKTRRRARTSTARSAIPASASPRSTT